MTEDPWVDRRRRFRELHRSGLFVMPNPWDVGSARVLASMGFEALATTSAGHAASLGRSDQHVAREEMLVHVAQLAEAVDVPLNVDAERCFAQDPTGVAATVELIAQAGAAGCSIEDYDPLSGGIDPLDMAVDRVAAAVSSAHAHGVVLTARAENHLYGLGDLEDTIRRLRAYRDAGADVLFAPGLVSIVEIQRLVEEVEAPVNVLALRRGPAVAELAAVGVRRVSTGASLLRAAYGALIAAARELQASGTFTYMDAAVTSKELEAAFAGI